MSDETKIKNIFSDERSIEILMDPRELEELSNKQDGEEYLKDNEEALSDQDAESLFTFEEYQFINDKVKRLPSKLSQVIFLRFWQELSEMEIAQRLNVPVHAVTSYLNSALKKLREEYFDTFAYWKFMQVINNSTNQP